MPTRYVSDNLIKLAKRHASKVRSFLNDKFQDECPFGDKLRAFVAKTGGQIQYLSNPDKEETLWVERIAKNKVRYTIFLPFDSTPARDNFTIAHELGHLFMHFLNSGEKEKSFGRRGSTLEEWEANRFAAEFLMPEDEFRRIAQEANNDPFRLARHFDVSVAAANVRMVSLGIHI